MSMKLSRHRAAVVFSLALAAVALLPSFASAAPTPVSGCRTLDTAGTYALATDISVADTTCIEIVASNVTFDLAGHTLSCTGSGFAGSCQVPEFASRGVSVAPGLTGITLTGPGTISGFDNGIVISASNVHISRLAITAPACGATDCSRPTSHGILGLETLGFNLFGNSVRNYFYGLRLIGARCTGTDAGCVINDNTVRDSTHWGILVDESTGYTVTQNVVRSNGTIAMFELSHAGGIALGNGGVGQTIARNDASDNIGWGIGLAPTANDNVIVKNTARGNQAGGARSGIGDFEAADLLAFPGTTNTWNDNNRCHVEGGAVPSTVCNPGE
jgi:parallel beta-helix repeat protein